MKPVLPRNECISVSLAYSPVNDQRLITSAEAQRWQIPPFVRFLNKAGGKLRVPYALKKRFNHREDMVTVEQLGNFELLITALIDHRVPGDFVELGSYTGSTAIAFAWLLDKLDPARALHVFDRFDIELGSAQGIRSLFEQRMRDRGVRMPVIHQGDVMTTVPSGLPDVIAFAHIDLGTGSDTALHTKLMEHALGEVYPRMPRGGVMVFMDYHVPGLTIGGNDSNPGVRAACDRFFAGRPERIHLLQGGACSHAYVRKA